MEFRVNTPQCEENPELNTFPGYKHLKSVILMAIREDSWLLPKELIYEELTKSQLNKLLYEEPSSLFIKDLDSAVLIDKDKVSEYSILVDDDEAWHYKWLLTYHRRKFYYMRQGLTEDEASKKAQATTSRAANKRQQRLSGEANTHRRKDRVSLRSAKLQSMTPEEIRAEAEQNMEIYLQSLASPVGGNYQAARDKKGK